MKLDIVLVFDTEDGEEASKESEYSLKVIAEDLNEEMAVTSAAYQGYRIEIHEN